MNAKVKDPIGKFFEEMGWDIIAPSASEQRLAECEERLRERESEVEALSREIRELRGVVNTLECPTCSKTVLIRDCVLLLHEFYVEPFSCSGGDYWRLSPTRSVRCSCGATHRTTSSEGLEQLKELEYSFKSIEVYREL